MYGYMTTAYTMLAVLHGKNNCGAAHSADSDSKLQLFINSGLLQTAW